MQAALKETVGMCQRETKFDGITLLQISPNKDCQQHDRDISKSLNPHTQLKYTLCFLTHI